VESNARNRASRTTDYLERIEKGSGRRAFCILPT